MSTVDQYRPDNVVTAKLQDGGSIQIELYGEGMTLLLPVNPKPIEGEQAEQMRQYGADPALGQSLIQGLCNKVRVAAFDYEGHLWQRPRPQSLTPEYVVSDFLTVADAVSAARFAYYGYSWLGMMGLQLALRTNRLAALIMGGFPPIEAPYKEMLNVTTAGYRMAGGEAADTDDEWSTSHLTKDQTQQYMTLYERLQDFDDEAAQAKITCPRLCFVGSADEIHYGANWGDVLVSLSGPVLRRRAELEKHGWDVKVFDGLDHMQTMQADCVVPMIRSWLDAKGELLNRK